jgi:signal transduction histidine kinase
MAIAGNGLLPRLQAENRVLNRIIEVLFAEFDLDDVLLDTAELIAEAISGDACFLHLLDETTGCLVLRAATDPFKAAVGRVKLEPGEGVAGWVGEHQETVVIVQDKRSDPRYKYLPELGGDQYTSLISVPLVSPLGKLIGVVNIHTAQRRDFAPDEVAFLEHVASLVATAIEHASMVRELALKEAVCQRVVEGTIHAQEEERRRIATEIHDGVTQHLISIWYRLNACEGVLDRDLGRAREELGAAKELIDLALDDARGAIYDLRPTTLDDLGLVPALRALAAHTLGPQVEVEFGANLPRQLPAHLETALYRIVQEALNNIRKHAGASHVEVRLEGGADGTVVILVADDGCGFDLAGYRKSRPETSFGLMGMTERVELVGGKLHITSDSSSGTRLEVRVPSEPPAAGIAGIG